MPYLKQNTNIIILCKRSLLIHVDSKLNCLYITLHVAIPQQPPNIAIIWLIFFFMKIYIIA